MAAGGRLIQRTKGANKVMRRRSPAIQGFAGRSSVEWVKWQQVDQAASAVCHAEAEARVSSRELGRSTSWMAKIVCWISPIGRFMPIRWKLAFHKFLFRLSDRLLPHSTTTFYTVQSQSDTQRLWRNGVPWPTEDIRAHFGPGVYAWRTRRDAEEYLRRVQPGAKEPVRILEFRVWNWCLRRFRSLDVNTIPEAEVDSWMNRHSLLGEGPFEPHGYQHLQRAVGFREVGEPAVEHYFSSSVFAHLWFYE
jgi:hypothetical protein